MKDFQETLHQFHEATARKDRESLLRAEQLEWDLISGKISRECAELGVYLYDADHWLESADEDIEALESYEEAKPENTWQYDDAWYKLGEARSYLDISYNRRYITEEEHKEILARLDAIHKALHERKWTEAREKLGDADKLAKRLLFTKLVQCECSKICRAD